MSCLKLCVRAYSRDLACNGVLDIYVHYLLNFSYANMRVSVSPTSAAVRATALFL